MCLTLLWYLKCGLSAKRRADDRPLSALSLPRGGLLGEYALSRPRKEQMVVLEGRISRACPLRGSLLGM